MYADRLLEIGYEEYSEIQPQLWFTCEANGRKLTAMVIDQLNHPFNEGDQITLSKIKSLWNAGSRRRVSPGTIDSEIARNVSHMVEARQ